MLALSLFLLGLASGVHCVGMCGGFVAAFQGIPIVKAEPRRWRRLLAFNAGRITSYAIAGAAAGVIGSQLLVLDAQNLLYIVANVLLIAIGLHLAGITSLSAIERIGAPLWRRLQPLAARTMAGPSAYTAGLLWGWIPCGLVYGALAAAAFAGSAQGGAAAMAAYGLGTLPWLMASGYAFRWLQAKTTRTVAGATVLAFGIYGLAHGTDLRGLLCI